VTTLFLLDQGLPRSAVAALSARGYSARHVGDLGMANATDEEILTAGRSMGAVVVTLDADFHSLLAMQRCTEPSVIRLRIEGLKAEPVAKVLDRVIRVAGPELRAGAAASVSASAVRIRRLPLA